MVLLKDELMTPVADIGEPRSARKRKIPSYLKEFDVEDTKVMLSILAACYENF